jgi:hypothetical protein
MVTGKPDDSARIGKRMGRRRGSATGRMATAPYARDGRSARPFKAGAQRNMSAAEKKRARRRGEGERKQSAMAWQSQGTVRRRKWCAQKKKTPKKKTELRVDTTLRLHDIRTAAATATAIGEQPHDTTHSEPHLTCDLLRENVGTAPARMQAAAASEGPHRRRAPSSGSNSPSSLSSASSSMASSASPTPSSSSSSSSSASSSSSSRAVAS